MKNCLMALLMMFGMNAFAEINKWVDENNQIHYSDQPPPVSVKARKLRSSSDTRAPAEASGETAASGPAAAKTIAEREAELKKTQQAKKEAADKSAQNQAKEESSKANCAAAQQNLKTLESGIRIPVFSVDGESTYMNDEQRQQRIAKTQQDIGRLCK